MYISSATPTQQGFLSLRFGIFFLFQPRLSLPPTATPPIRAIHPSGGGRPQDPKSKIQLRFLALRFLVASSLSALARLPLCPTFLLLNSSVKFLTEE